jgi:hypothetical protein
MLLDTGITVDEVYNTLHTNLAKFDIAMCVGELHAERTQKGSTIL